MDKKIITIFYAILILVFASSVFATNFDFYRNDGTGGTIFDPGWYAGDTTGIPNSVVKNKNLACKIRCTFQTNQGESGTVPGVAEGYISAQQESPRFSIPVTASGSSTLTTTVTCYDEDSTFCSSSSSDTLSKAITMTWDSCGDGTIQPSKEICDGGTRTCSLLDNKYYSTRSASCKSDCSGYTTSTCEYCGDGARNGPEGCDSGNSNGRECTASYGSSCNYCSNSCQTVSVTGPYCGDGNKDSPENCKSCYQDAPCEDGQGACNANGICIDLDSDENCGAIGNRCDTTPKSSSSGQTHCSSDYTKAVNVLQITTEKCVNRVCQKETKNQNQETNCRLTNTYCQDGACGCSTGYEICESLKKCTKKKDVKLNQPCGCDFQCEAGFCDESSRVCVKGLNVQLSASNPTLNVGDETTLSLSVSNPLPRDVTADITLSLGDSLELVEVLSGDQCAGSQCKLDRTTIPSGGKKDVTVKVRASSYTNTRAEAFVNYLSGSKAIELEETTSIKVLQCGNGKIEEGETSETCCIDAKCPTDNRFYSFTCNKNTKSCDKSIHSYFIYGGVGALVLIFLIIIGIGRAITNHKKHAGEKSKEKEEKQEEKEKSDETEDVKNKEEHEEKEETKEPKKKSNSSIAEEIEHLHALMEKGALTKREFEKRKKKLLKEKD